MRKIHPGFTALVILLGPAVIISGHQKLSNSLSAPVRSEPGSVEKLQQIYFRCSEPSKLQRTVQCDQFVSYFDKCIAAKNQCDPRSSYELLIKLEFSSPPSNRPPVDTTSTIRMTGS